VAVGTAEDAGFRAPRRAPNNQSATPGRLGELILGSLKIAVDETVAPVLDLGRGRTKKGYFWAIAPDDRPWGGTDPPAIAYTYAPGRGAVHALKLLDTYHGIVQCDGCAAYRTWISRGGASASPCGTLL
jgi:transposase